MRVSPIRWLAIPLIILATALPACSVITPPTHRVYTSQLIPLPLAASATPTDMIHHTPTPTLAPATPTFTPTPTPLPTLAPIILARDETRGTVTVRAVTIKNYYGIGGATVEAIEAQMLTLGPTDETSGTHWYALTEPVFDWRIEKACSDQGCAAAQITVLVTNMYSFPHWFPPIEADDVLRAKWATFEGAVVTHEMGHGQLAVECGWRLGEAFSALPPAPTSDALDQAFVAASHTVFPACRDAQRAYENETNHGYTQGVVWMP